MNVEMRWWVFVMASIGICFANAAEIANNHQTYIAQYATEYLPLGMDANSWYDFLSMERLECESFPEKQVSCAGSTPTQML